ncbi:MAG: hypothetical protein NTY64_05265 [Deltaproteobacteria bacterium]|nr:hypothetical protein [Deltaproteobacteria bacterium]
MEFADGRMEAIHALESPWDTEYPLPDLSTLELSFEGSHLLPLGQGNTLTVNCDGRSLVLNPEFPEDLHREINHLLERHDPDLIFTDHGDSFIIPSLLKLSQRWRVPLQFDREVTPIRRAIVTEGRSYFSYGSIVYNAPDYPFFGRLHIDRENSFFHLATPGSPRSPSSAWPGAVRERPSAPCSSTGPFRMAFLFPGTRASRRSSRRPGTFWWWTKGALRFSP